ncbi:MAG: transposase family protein [Caldilineaceae bacterium]|nr:transposase family protein [Caldilineaceae bacterium]
MNRTQQHHLTDMWVPTVPAVICGADSFEVIALFGQLNEAGLFTFPELPHEILSPGTLERVRTRRDATRLEAGFRDWVQGTLALTAGQVVVAVSGTL